MAPVRFISASAAALPGLITFKMISRGEFARVAEAKSVLVGVEAGWPEI
jgi:hypothetical protein